MTEDERQDELVLAAKRAVVQFFMPKRDYVDLCAKYGEEVVLNAFYGTIDMYAGQEAMRQAMKDAKRMKMLARVRLLGPGLP